MSEQSPIVANAPKTAMAANTVLCQNCRSPLLGDFCYECGQPRKGWIRQISGIVGDFLDSVFNFDSRTFRTLGPLFFRPGFLSTEYFAGRRVRYVTPLRLYFFLSVIAFLLLSWNTTVNNGDGFIRVGNNTEMSDPARRLRDLNVAEKSSLAGLNTAKSFMPQAEFEAAMREMKADFAEQRRAIQKEIKALEDAKAKDAGKQADAGKNAAPETPPAPPALIRPPPMGASGSRAAKAPDPDDPNPNKVSVFGEAPWHPTKNPVRISWFNASMNLWLNDQVGRMIKNSEIANKDPQKYVNEVFSEAPTVLFVMLPFFALLLKFVYLFKRRLYMEHLIVALHSHSFICFSIIVIGLLTRLRGWSGEGTWLSAIGGLTIALIWIWMPIYLLISQKRIYQQGWLMTLLKYGFVGFCYVFMLLAGLIALLILSLANL